MSKRPKAWRRWLRKAHKRRHGSRSRYVFGKIILQGASGFASALLHTEFRGTRHE